jgi:uncharacterized protein (DUF4213/DUF364 family)
MSLLDDLLATVTEDVAVRAVLVGAHWTVVCSRGCGLAATYLGAGPHGHSMVREAGRLHLKSGRQLAELARSDDLLEASIGVAALNALLEVDEGGAQEVNAVEVLCEQGKGKRLALVGHFPFIPRLRQSAGQLWVIEQRPVEGEYPAEAAADLIPQAEVVAITGSALINHTLEGLLALCQPEAAVMILGPSTPLSAVLYDYGATMLSGARVVDEAAVLQTVGQGASFPQVQGVRLLTLSRGRTGFT